MCVKGVIPRTEELQARAKAAYRCSEIARAVSGELRTNEYLGVCLKDLINAGPCRKDL